MANSVHGSVENIVPKYSISTPKSTQKHNTLIYDTDWSRTTIIKDIPSCLNLNLVAMYKTPVTLLTVCNNFETRRFVIRDQTKIKGRSKHVYTFKTQNK